MAAFAIVIAAGATADAQGPSAAQIQGQYDKAVQVFGSINQPDSIALFTSIVDGIKASSAGAPAPELTLMLYRSLRYRNEAAFNLARTSRIDADLCAAAKDGFRVERAEVSALFYDLVRTQCALLVSPAPPPVGFLVVNITPSDARVWIDATPESAPLGGIANFAAPIRVSPGTHTVYVARRGFVSSRMEVTVETGQRVPVTAVLDPFGRLLLSIRPSTARVQLNGSTVDAAQPIPLPPGQHELRVSAPAPYIEKTLQVSAAPGQEQRVSVDLARVRNLRPRRLFFNADRSYRMYVPAFSSFAPTVVYAQNGSVTTDYTVPDDMEERYSFGGSARIVGPLAIGLTFSEVVLNTAGAVAASVPTQFILNRPRAVSGTAVGLTRNERALHLEVRATGGGKYAEAAVFGGPSFFTVRQSLVDGITFREPGPVFVSARFTDREAKAKVGVHVGADLAVLFGGYAGFGFTARYSYGEVEFTAADGSPLPIKVGGLQLGGGLRVRF